MREATEKDDNDVSRRLQAVGFDYGDASPATDNAITIIDEADPTAIIRAQPDADGRWYVQHLQGRARSLAPLIKALAQALAIRGLQARTVRWDLSRRPALDDYVNHLLTPRTAGPYTEYTPAEALTKL
ncbi:MAG: hypothetical protein A2V63_13370 [Candidatus Eisenbacteria bacterium RBG_19FT_COMBO_70_11]|nr:MAG: hypothetical protein A2V63_13370 [Candidatus Eisenbacteria bacterium RBG_19FT_COMBO_70_11]